MKRLFLLFTIALLHSGMTISAQTSLLWSESAGTSATSQKSFVATDLIGNIYMASSVNGTYGLDWKISSWRPDSVSRWTYTFNGSGNLDDIPAAIVVDSAFNVYISGTTKSSGSNDIRVMKLDSAGNLKWGTNYNRTGSAQDVGTGLAVVAGNLWVSGHSQQSTSNYDYTLLKYDTAGTLSWSRHCDGSLSGDDYTTSVAVRANGDAYVTGNAVAGTGNIRDIMTVRYLANGTLSWTNYYGGTTGQHDYGNDVKIDGSGNVLVTGQTYLAANNSDLVLIKYTSGGSQSWAATYSGASKKHDAGKALMIGSDGYFYVTGFMQTTGGTNNYVTIRYNSSGTVSWAQTYDGPGASDDEACAILEDGNDVVITGKSTGSGTGLDVCTISMLKSSGSVNWTMRYTSSSSGTDCGYNLAKDEMGNVLVACNKPASSAFENFSLKYYQKAKNDQAVEDNLRILAKGFSDLVTDTVFKRVIWYNILRGYDDSIYIMYADQARTLGDATGTSMTAKINTKISTTYGWNSSYNWAVIKSKQIWIGNQKGRPLLAVPRLYSFSKSQFISSTTNTAYTHTDIEYPIGCTTCGDATLDSVDVVAADAAWIFTINIPAFVFYPESHSKPYCQLLCWSTQCISKHLPSMSSCNDRSTSCN